VASNAKPSKSNREDRVLCYAREGGSQWAGKFWIPAFAGMTQRRKAQLDSKK
jgi:hypothetical protein